MTPIESGHFVSSSTTAGHSWTLTQHVDGEDAASGVSYLELAEVLINHGANTNADLRELWTRIVFNMMVCNTDDHLRNHGFVLEPGRGWHLSPAYDMNPDPYGRGLKLNVSEADNALDLDLALSVAPLFRVKSAEAQAIVDRLKAIIRQWPKLADALSIGHAEQERLSPAFKLSHS